jgi:hypothetical protein
LTVSSTVQVGSGKYITLDLNGHTLSGTRNSAAIIHNYYGNLTIMDSKTNGSIVNEGTDGYAIKNEAGTLTIESGTFTAKKYPIYVMYAQDTVNISGGVFTGGTYGAWFTKGNITITGGTFTGTTAAIFVGTYANATITGGTFSSDISAMVADSAMCVANDGGTYTVTSAVAKIGDTKYATLNDAIEAAPTNGTETTIKLLANTSEDITIAANQKIILDLNGKTLINKSDHTITNSGTLTINGTGLVDNATNGKAAIYNKESGVVTLNGGNYDRCNEDGQGAYNSGTNSHYTLENYGTMTINEGVTVTQHGKFSSMIKNGYTEWEKEDPLYKSTKGTNDEQYTSPKLTINGGYFNGGLNTLKNDDHGIAVINGGTFENFTQNAILNTTIGTMTITDATVDAKGTYERTDKTTNVTTTIGVCPLYNKGVLTVKGGEFTSADGYALTVDKGTATTKATIEGGTFTSSSKVDGLIRLVGDVRNEYISIAGGTFSKEPTSTYIATDYATVKNTDGTYTVAKETKQQAAETPSTITITTVTDAENPAGTTDKDATVSSSDTDPVKKALDNVAKKHRSHKLLHRVCGGGYGCG